jgi:uncharacterized protein (DUF2147 family)
MKTFATLIALAGLTLAAPLAANAPAPIAGRWSNPKDSVVVEVAPCGAAMCGTVVSATAKAKADARKGGTSSLVGTRLMSNFKPIGGGKYRGKVLLPKRGMHATGTIRLAGRNTLVVEGCALGGIICKEQRWDRVG